MCMRHMVTFVSISFPFLKTTFLFITFWIVAAAVAVAVVHRLSSRFLCWLIGRSIGWLVGWCISYIDWFRSVNASCASLVDCHFESARCGRTKGGWGSGEEEKTIAFHNQNTIDYEMHFEIYTKLCTAAALLPLPAIARSREYENENQQKTMSRRDMFL